MDAGSSSTHGLLGHPALTQPIKNILLRKQNVRIWLSRWKTVRTILYNSSCHSSPRKRLPLAHYGTITYGIVIEDLQFTLAGNEQIPSSICPSGSNHNDNATAALLLVGFIAGYFVNAMAYHLSPWRIKRR